jgi:hypothetical protein
MTPHHRHSSEEPEKGLFHLEDKDQEASQQTPPRRTTTPETLPLLTPTPSRESFRPTLRPMPARKTRRRWTATPAVIIRSARGEHLGPPSIPPTTNDTRVATPCPACGRTDNDREGPDLQGNDGGRKQPTTAANHHRHRVARRRTSAALRPRDMFTHEHEACRCRQPPQATTNLHRERPQKPNPSPALSPGKVGLQHRRLATSHRCPCRRLPGCRAATPQNREAHRRLLHPTLDRQTPEAFLTPPSPRAVSATTSPPRARRRRTGTHPTTNRSRSSVEPQIRPALHLTAWTAAHAGELLHRPEAATPTPLHRREEDEGPAATFLAGARNPGDPLGRRGSTVRGGGG